MTMITTELDAEHYDGDGCTTYHVDDAPGDTFRECGVRYRVTSRVRVGDEVHLDVDEDDEAD
jgi:hypothetical protein